MPASPSGALSLPTSGEVRVANEELNSLNAADFAIDLSLQERLWTDPVLSLVRACCFWRLWQAL